MIVLNTYGARNHGGHFSLHAPSLKVEEATAPPFIPSRLRRPCVCIFVPSSLVVRGYYLRENFDILDARMCFLERIQRKLGIVDEKNLLRLNT